MTLGFSLIDVGYDRLRGSYAHERQGTHALDINNRLRTPWHRFLYARRQYNAPLYASALSFAAVLSIFPALLASMVLISYIARRSSELYRELQRTTWASWPILRDFLGTELRPQRLGISSILGLIVVIWSASKFFRQLHNFLLVLWPGEVKEESIWRRKGVSYLRGLIAVVLFACAFFGSALVITVLPNFAVFSSIAATFILSAITIRYSVQLALFALHPTPGWRTYRVPAIASGLAFSFLQISGGIALQFQLEKLTPQYGVIAIFLVIAVWITLHVMVLINALVWERTRNTATTITA